MQSVYSTDPIDWAKIADQLPLLEWITHLIIELLNFAILTRTGAFHTIWVYVFKILILLRPQIAKVVTHQKLIAA